MNSHSRVSYKKVGLEMLAEAMNVSTARIWAESGFSNSTLYSPEMVATLAATSKSIAEASVERSANATVLEYEEEGE
jgi:hypothetical protein